MSGLLVSFAGYAAVDEVFDVCTDILPCVISAEKLGHAVLTRVSSGGVVVTELEDAGAKVAGWGRCVRDVDMMFD